MTPVVPRTGCSAWAVVLVLASLSAEGQSGRVTLDSAFLSFDAVGVEQGLGAGLVFDLTQDSLGYLWLGTRTGLCRYDGYDIRTFSKADEVPDGLSDNNVNRVFRDSRNLLWIDTELGGSRVFDPFRERWYRLPFSLGPNLTEDGKGNVWCHDEDSTWRVVDGSGIRRVLRGERSWEDLTARPVAEAFPDAPIPRDSRLLAVGDDALWVGGYDSIWALRYFPEGTRLARVGAWALTHPQRGERQAAHGAWDSARQLVIWCNATEWMSFREEDAVLQERVSWPGEGIDRVLLAVAIDGLGHTWMSGALWMWRYDPSTHRLCRVFDEEASDARSSSQPLRHSYHILRDAHDNLWFATPGFGAYKRRACANLFRYWGYRHAGPSISRIHRDPQGHAVIWNESTNLRFAGTDLPPVPFFPPSEHRWLQDRLPLAADLWFTDRGETVVYGTDRVDAPQQHVRYGPDGNRLETWSWADSLPHPSRFSRYLFDEDSCSWSVTPDDFLRVNTRSVSLYRWDTSGTGTYARFTHRIPDAGVPVRFLHASARTDDGSIWLAYLHGGLFRFRPSDGLWRHYAPDGDVPLPSTQVISLLADPGEPGSGLWIGTYDGLFRLDLGTDSLERFDRTTGLPDDVIYGILPDDAGNLWLSTNRGLCRFTPNGGMVRTFTRDDGLQHNEFNRRAAVRGSDGTLYFGGIGGLTWFHPEWFRTPAPQAHLVIHELRLLNRPSDKRVAREPGDPSDVATPLHGLTTFRWHQRDRIVSFGFSRLDLSRPEMTRYRYRLAGFQEGWIDLGQRHEVTFTNLPPGRYRLEVQSMDDNGQWDPSTARLFIGVTPYWYNSLAFRSALLLLFLGGVFGLFRYRQRQIERLHGLRDRISRDLHDEIGSTLSSIALFSTVARRNLERDPQQVASLLHRMEGSSQSVMESMNDIVWAIRSDQDRIHHVVQRMRAFLAEACEARAWTFGFTEDAALAERELSMVQRRNLYLVFKEAVNNAIKYSGGTRLEVALTRERGELLLLVRDDGTGFDPAAPESTRSLGGNGLPNMRLRATEMGGRLELDTAPGQGTTVTLRFRP